MELVLTKIHRSSKDKDGNAYMTKATPNSPSRAYERVGIQVNDEKYTGKWLSGFGNRENAGWQVGDTVDLEITQNGQYWNFKTLSQEDKIWKELQRQAGEIHKLKKEMADVRRNFGEVPEDEVGKVNEDLTEAKELEDSLPF